MFIFDSGEKKISQYPPLDPFMQVNKKLGLFRPLPGVAKGFTHS